MKEEHFELNTFIGGWYISKKICNDLIDLFEKKTKRQKEGRTGYSTNPEVKESTDISLWNTDTALDEYNDALYECLKLYMKKYPETQHELSSYDNSSEGTNIQKYLPGQGFKKWHCERTGIAKNIKRVLVYMTYLNDVKDGGTEFKYQKIKTEAKQGLTLIWPCEFTHTHRGIIANETKFVTTGWYNFIK